MWKCQRGCWRFTGSSVGSWQKAVGKRQLAKGSWQKAVGKKQFTKNGWQKTVGKKQLTVNKKQ